MNSTLRKPVRPSETPVLISFVTIALIRTVRLGRVFTAFEYVVDELTLAPPLIVD